MHVFFSTSKVDVTVLSSDTFSWILFYAFSEPETVIQPPEATANELTVSYAHVYRDYITLITCLIILTPSPEPASFLLVLYGSFDRPRRGCSH